MTKKTTYYLNWLVTLAAIFVAVVALVGQAQPAQPEAPAPPVPLAVSSDTSNFTNIAASGTAAITGNTTVGGTLGVTGASTLTGAITGSSTATFADEVTSSAEVTWAGTHITPTTGTTLTISDTVYIVETTGAITMTLGTTGADEGQFVVFIGADANNVTVNDTDIRTSTGAALTIGQYDIVVFMYDGHSWIEWLILANS